jgi:hypothetical protein
VKVQIYAGALVAAADRYLAAIEPEFQKEEARIAKDVADRQAEYGKPRKWWDILGFPMLPMYPIWPNKYTEQRHRVETFRAIAKHKRPETLLEITDPELEGIAPYLSEYEPERI